MRKHHTRYLMVFRKIRLSKISLYHFENIWITNIYTHRKIHWKYWKILYTYIYISQGFFFQISPSDRAIVVIQGANRHELSTRGFVQRINNRRNRWNMHKLGSPNQGGGNQTHDGACVTSCVHELPRVGYTNCLLYFLTCKRLPEFPPILKILNCLPRQVVQYFILAFASNRLR